MSLISGLSEESKTLSQTMEEVLQKLSIQEPAPEPLVQTPAPNLAPAFLHTQLAAFECLTALLGMDETLAALYKNLLVARDTVTNTNRQFGADAPLTDIAKTRFDSALAAFEARLHDLRRQSSEQGTQDQDTRNTPPKMKLKEPAQNATRQEDSFPFWLILFWLTLMQQQKQPSPSGPRPRFTNLEKTNWRPAF